MNISMKKQITKDMPMQKEEIDDLKFLVIDAFEDTGLDVKPDGGYRGGIMRQNVDWGRICCLLKNDELGFFEYELTNGTYNIQFDLRNMPSEIYERFIEITKTRFPQIYEIFKN